MLSLYYMRGVLPEGGEIKYYTLKDEIGLVAAELIANPAEVLCFAVYIWNSAYLEELLPCLTKAKAGLILVLGGPEATALYRRMGEPGRTHVVTGPGEAAFRELSERDFAAPYGPIERENTHLKDIPFPYNKEDLGDLSGKLVYYETSRGCPFGCIYCLSANDKRNEMRFDTALEEDRRRLYAELDALVALNPRTLKFVDRSFNTDKALARLIWSYFIQRPDACISHFEIYPDLLTEEDIELLAQVQPGKIRFEVGIQTTDPGTMRLSHRVSDWQKAKQMLIRLKEKTGIIIHADLLIGLPGDGLDSVMRSIDELIGTLPDELQLGLLKVLPDTPMRIVAEERGYSTEAEPPYAIRSSDMLSQDEVAYLVRLSQTINLYYNKGEFVREWADLLELEKGTAILRRLEEYHNEQNIPLHSMQKQHRREVFRRIAMQERE